MSQGGNYRSHNSNQNKQKKMKQQFEDDLDISKFRFSPPQQFQNSFEPLPNYRGAPIFQNFDVEPFGQKFGGMNLGNSNLINGFGKGLGKSGGFPEIDIPLVSGADSSFADAIAANAQPSAQALAKAQVWEGPAVLNTGFYKSKLPLNDVVEKITTVLEQLVNQEEIDYSVDKDYELSGRVFHSKTGEVAEFRIDFYDAAQEDNASSIVYVRRQNGDGFLYNNFQDKLLKTIDPVSEEKDSLDPFSLPNPFSIHLELPSDDGDDDNNDENVSFQMSDLPPLNYDISLPPLPMMMQDKEEEKEDEVKDDFFENLNTDKFIEDTIEDVTSSEAFMEEIHSGLCVLYTLNAEQLDIVKKQNQVLEKFMKTIKNSFDVHQVRTLLLVILRLLEANVKPPQGFGDDLDDVKSLWQEGRTRDIGEHTINFGRSQQVEKVCNKCKALI